MRIKETGFIGTLTATCFLLGVVHWISRYLSTLIEESCYHCRGKNAGNGRKSIRGSDHVDVEEIRDVVLGDDEKS